MSRDETHDNSAALLVELGTKLDEWYDDGKVDRIQIIGVLEALKHRILIDASEATLIGR